MTGPLVIAECGGCRADLTDATMEEWRAWVQRIALSVTGHGDDPITITHAAGYAHLLCSGCSAQLDTGQYRQLAESIVDTWYPGTPHREFLVGDSVPWLLRIRENSAPVAGWEWLATILPIDGTGGQ